MNPDQWEQKRSEHLYDVDGGLATPSGSDIPFVDGKTGSSVPDVSRSNDPTPRVTVPSKRKVKPSRH
jgi:hypothetical protein